MNVVGWVKAPDVFHHSPRLSSFGQLKGNNGDSLAFYSLSELVDIDLSVDSWRVELSRLYQAGRDPDNIRRWRRGNTILIAIGPVPRL